MHASHATATAISHCPIIREFIRDANTLALFQQVYVNPEAGQFVLPGFDYVV